MPLQATPLPSECRTVEKLKRTRMHNRSLMIAVQRRIKAHLLFINLYAISVTDVTKPLQSLRDTSTIFLRIILDLAAGAMYNVTKDIYILMHCIRWFI
jgi:hypothetical protein